MAMFFPYLELTASIITLLFAYYIGTRHYQNKIARFYVRFAMIVFFSCICTYSFRIAFTLELARDINRLSATLVAFAFSLFAHFALNFTRRENIISQKITLLLLYLPPSLLGLLFIFTNWMYQRYEILPYGIASIPAPAYALFMAQNFAYAAWGVVLFLLYAKSAPQKVERSQARLIAIGCSVPVMIGLITDEIIPLIFQTRPIPPTLVFDFTLMTFFIYLAMRRYSLFAISPALAAGTIIETMPDSLIVTNLDGKVLLVNEAAHKYFRVPKEEIIGKLICSLFDKREKYDQLYDEVAEKNLKIERFAADLRDPLGELLPSLINSRVMRDELGSMLGIIFVIRDLRG